MKKKHFFIFVFLVFQILLFSEIFEFSFDSFSFSKKDGFDVIEMDDAFSGNIPGEPILPMKVAYLIIPFGEDIKEISCSSEQLVLEGKHEIPPVASEYPISEEIYPIEKKSKIYSQNLFYPPEKFRKIGIQRKSGVDILIVQLFPFQYNPVSGKIIHHKKMELHVEFVKNSAKEEMQIRKLLNYEKLLEKFALKSITKEQFLNQNALSSYQGKSRYWKNSRTSLVSSDDPFDYIIITNATLENEWSELVAQKENFGLSVNIYTVEEIFANYTGNDNPDKIRNFIIDAYDTWSGTDHPLQWILIGGDSNIVTARSVRVHAYWGSSWNYASMYTDNYYAGLDGDWNNDADSYYGEGDNDQVPDDFPETWILGTSGEEADCFFEVNIGRASLEDASEIDNWLNKTISYEDLSCSEDYLKTSTFVGQYLGYGAYGGTAQDEIAMFLPEFNHNRLYQMNGTYSKTNVVNAINNGTNIISHLGHANYLRVFDIYDGDVDTLLTNTDYCFVYSQGCHTGMYSLDCIAESFLEKEHAAFAYIGNSHYGFYSSYKDQGSSQLFEREFFDAIMNEGISNLGNANYDSKEDLAGIIGATGSRRWVGMDLTLFGDPHLSLHLDIGDVSAEQTAGNEITISYEETPGTGADDYENYSIYERDEPDSTIAVTSCSVNGNNVILYLNNDLKEGIPYNVEISDVSEILNPTIRPIETISNIIELSIITPTTWSAEDGPYYIYEDLIVKGSNLTIEAGTEIKLNEGKEVVVYDGGWLKAIGTEDEQIVFTSYENSSRATNGDWMDILFYRDADHENCEINFCLIEYAITGICLDSTSTATIKNTIITHTKESGIYSYCANPTIENVVVAFAEGSDNDYGFYFEHSEPSINNIVSYENDSFGIYAADSSNIILNNSIIYGNTSGSISTDSSSVNITFSDIEGGFSGDGNINIDPLFADPSDDDFSLQSISPCIDTGDPESFRDPDGTRADMGAIYFAHLFDFMADKMFGYDSLQVTFSDLTESEITDWSWDFENDGIYDSFEESPTFSYTQPGIYSVKMKIERTAWSDTLIKTNYIVIQESQLDPPENLTITFYSNDVLLEWSAIDTTRFDNSRNELYYLVYYSNDPYTGFDFLDFTNAETTAYIHTDIVQSNDKMFYLIIGYVGALERLNEYIDKKRIGKSDKFFQIDK